MVDLLPMIHCIIAVTADIDNAIFHSSTRRTIEVDKGTNKIGQIEKNSWDMEQN